MDYSAFRYDERSDSWILSPLPTTESKDVNPKDSASKPSIESASIPSPPSTSFNYMQPVQSSGDHKRGRFLKFVTKHLWWISKVEQRTSNSGNRGISKYQKARKSSSDYRKPRKSGVQPTRFSSEYTDYHSAKDNEEKIAAAIHYCNDNRRASAS